MLQGGVFIVQGFEVGHAQDVEAATGCTVVLCPENAAGAARVYGSASGSRELDTLSPTHLAHGPHGVLLTGGSAFGLGAADGVMAWLEQNGRGLVMPGAVVPIVPAAVIYDLGLGRADVRPGPDMGAAACDNAAFGRVAEGSVGAGCGATVGEFYGPAQAMKGGLGAATIELESGLALAALAVVNALGDVVDHRDGRLLAGVRTTPDGLELADAQSLFLSGVTTPLAQMIQPTNTTLVVVATNAKLDKVRLSRLAGQAQLGLARSIRPVQTLVDGDLAIALGGGEAVADDLLLGALAAEATAEAIRRAITEADSLGLIPAYRDLNPHYS